MSQLRKIENPRHLLNMSSYRLGNVAAGGRGRPFIPRTKTYKMVNSCKYTPTAGHVPAMVFDLTAYNMLGLLATSSHIASAGGQRHGTGHVEAIAQGFDEAQILESYYRLSFYLGPTGTKDYVVCYKFASGLLLTEAIATNTDNELATFWLDLRTSKAWIWKIFSGNSAGGSIYPSAGVINIKIPSIGKLVHGLQEGTPTNPSVVANPLSVAIDDEAAQQTSEFRGLLHVYIFHRDGTASAAGDWVIDLDIFSTAKIMKSIETGVEMIDEEDIGETS